jgi:hypothetical protein
MPAVFVSERITPLETSFDTRLMSQGEPGLPLHFLWRRREWHVAAILEQWKAHGDCTHGSGERYVRRHVYRVQTEEGPVLRLYFQRTFGRGRPSRSRWWIHSVESGPGEESLSHPG